MMTGRLYLRAIVPIGLCFSLSLICGNLTYLYLSVAFIQMLKATTPVAVLLCSWAMGLQQPSLRLLANVSVIVFGVVLASVGEIQFVLIGFLYQVGGIIFEAVRLTMVQRLLSSAEYKMDPLVSLYYFAPVCAVINGIVALLWEVPSLSMPDVYLVGLGNFFVNGLVAFLLNVSVVFLVCVALVIFPRELITNGVLFHRLTRPRPSSSPSVASSRTLCLLSPPCSSGVPKSARCSYSAIALPCAAWSTTSSATTP